MEQKQPDRIARGVRRVPGLSRRVYIVAQPHHRNKSRKLLVSLHGAFRTLGCDAQYVAALPRDSGLFVFWGAGKPETADMIEAVVARGDRAVCLDMGYWNSLSFRVAFDGHHPLELPEDPSNGKRLKSQGIHVRDGYHDPQGEIILVGLGPKSRHMGTAWEVEAGKRIERELPGRPILFRPKPGRPHLTLPYETDETSSVNDLLRGASQVVCRHSNFGIDACIVGVPVTTEAGVARLLYNNDLVNPLSPPIEERQAFLERVAWLNWTFGEAKRGEFSRWILDRM